MCVFIIVAAGFWTSSCSLREAKFALQTHSFLRLHSDLVLISSLSNLDSGQKKKKKKKKKKKNSLLINLLMLAACDVMWAA